MSIALGEQLISPYLVGSTVVVGSVRALMNGVIDYAGMFPPASLSLEEALRNYNTYLRGEHAWVLSRFVCAVSILEGIEVYAPVLFKRGTPTWRIAAIGQGGEDLISFLQVLQRDLASIASFSAQRAIPATVDMLELKVPPCVVEGGEEKVCELVERSSEAVASSVPGVTPVYEIGFGAGGPEAVYSALSALKRFNDNWAGQRYRPAAAKIRTGGLSPEAVPSSNQLAFFISACKKLGLAFKATAGLHHPFRHLDKTLGVEVHGFVNVFVATVMAQACSADLPTIVRVLDSAKLSDFMFEEDGLSWCAKKASLAQISEARQSLGTSYGSCSFTEPLADLQKLKLF